jgi:hypothetical protein
MYKTYIWMAVWLVINWGGFIWLILRTLKKRGSDKE